MAKYLWLTLKGDKEETEEWYREFLKRVPLGRVVLWVLLPIKWKEKNVYP